MIRRPPRSTRTDTLFPYTTLFRSSIRLNERSLFRQSGELKPCLIAAYYIDKLTKGDPIYIIEPITHILEREARVHVFDDVHHSLYDLLIIAFLKQGCYNDRKRQRTNSSLSCAHRMHFCDIK